MATGKKLADFGELSAAEQALVEACRKGDLCKLGDGTRPEGPDDHRNIRAEVLGFLILGGGEDCRTHTSGVILAGAHVTGTLNLSFGRAVGGTSLINCRFEEKILALQSRIELFNLEGSACPGLMAQGSEVIGSVFLRNGFEATGEVSFAGAKIGGQLACAGGRFTNATGDALNAEGAQVKDNVVLNAGFHSEGEVSLAGSNIGG